MESDWTEGRTRISRDPEGVGSGAERVQVSAPPRHGTRGRASTSASSTTQHGRPYTPHGALSSGFCLMPHKAGAVASSPLLGVRLLASTFLRLATSPRHVKGPLHHYDRGWAENAVHGE